MALGISKILVEVESHSIQQIITILHRQLLDHSHEILLTIGRRSVRVFAVFSSSTSLSLDTSSIDAEASAVCTLGLGRIFEVLCLPFPLHLGLSSQSQYRCPVCLHPKHFPAAISFLRSSSGILCIFAASNCMG